MNNYQKAKELGLTNKNRWEDGISHHPKSEELMKFLEEHDFKDYKDYFCWKTGGDGDNGEFLMYQMDAFFELQDKNSLTFVCKNISKDINNKEFLKTQKKYLALDEDLKKILDSDDDADALEERMNNGDRPYGIYKRDDMFHYQEDVIDMGGGF